MTNEYINYMPASKVVLIACGSFNPPTNMHLRMFEIAKDHLHRLGTHVVGGIISPVHDSYMKAELVPAKHRLAMVKLALQGNPWVKMSDWETRQETWTRTRQSLQYHQNQLNSLLNNSDANCNENNLDWMDSCVLNNCNNRPGDAVRVKLLCGADLLESFSTPGLWANEDIESIVGQHGLVVITRECLNPKKMIYNSDVLTKYMGNITIVTEWITNEVSSTKIRRALRRCESVRYLIPDRVIEYIEKHGLYGCKKNNINTFIIPIHTTPMSLTPPSPPSNATHNSTVLSATPSPTNCIHLCNNNIFASMTPRLLSLDLMPDLSRKNLPAAKSKSHPGQAVKVVAGVPEVTRTQSEHVLTNAHSCTTELERNNTDDDGLERKSCDENLIKFILTKHGIQVISDVETII